MIELVNGCYRCKRDYSVTEHNENGKPAHVHYCNDCVKKCSKCNLWFVITHFLPILEHPAYQDWVRSKASEHDNPLGLLMGRDVVDDHCMGCKPFREPVAPQRVHESPVRLAVPEPLPEAIDVTEEEDGLARLEALLAKRKQSKA